MLTLQYVHHDNVEDYEHVEQDGMKDYSLSHENDEQQKEEYQDSKDFHHQLSIRSHRLEVSKIKMRTLSKQLTVNT